MLLYSLIILHIPAVLSGEEVPQWDKFNNMMNKLMGCRESTAAFSISAVKDQKEVFLNAYGYANKEKNIAATNSTRFSIGSISKTFAAYLTGTFVENGEFSWDSTIVGTFAKYGTTISLDGSYRSKSATIADALSHRTGIKQYDWLLADNRNFTRAKWITEFFPLFEEFSDLRSTFYYNNWLYTLIGYLAELVGGVSYESQIKSKVFDRLGMSETCFVSDSKFDTFSGAQLSQPYKEISDGKLYPVPLSALKTIGMHNPAGGIISTASDMSKYMIAIMNAYNNMNTSPAPLLSPKVLGEITKPRAILPMQLGDGTVVEKPTFPVSFVDQGYGLGYIIGFYRGYKYLNHGGSAHGHYSLMTLLPNLNISVYSVISGDDYQHKDSWRAQKVIHMYILDVLMGEEGRKGDDPWLNTDNACTFPAPWIKDFKLPAANYKEEATDTTITGSERFVGIYEKAEFPEMKIHGSDDELQFEMGNVNGVIVPLVDEKLRYALIVNLPVDPLNLPQSEKSRAYLTFTLSENNSSKVEGVTLRVAPEDFNFVKNKVASKSLSTHIILFTIFMFSFICS